MAIVNDGITNSKRISGMGKKLGVSNDGDLQQCFSSSQKNQLWYFNNNQSIWDWAKYKPQNIPSVAVGPLTEAQRKANNWGFINIPVWNNIHNMAMFWSGVSRTSTYQPICGIQSEYWKYDHPSGWAASSPRRASDFESFWYGIGNSTPCRIVPLLNFSSTGDESPIIEGNNMKLAWETDAAYIGQPKMYQYKLQIKDFLGTAAIPPAQQMYFGYMFVDPYSPNGRYMYMTQSTEIGYIYDVNNPTATAWGSDLDFPFTDITDITGDWKVFPFLSSNKYTTPSTASASGTFVALMAGPEDVTVGVHPQGGGFYLSFDGILGPVYPSKDGRYITVSATVELNYPATRAFDMMVKFTYVGGGLSERINSIHFEPGWTGPSSTSYTHDCGSAAVANQVTAVIITAYPDSEYSGYYGDAVIYYHF